VFGSSVTSWHFPLRRRDGQPPTIRPDPPPRYATSANRIADPASDIGNSRAGRGTMMDPRGDQRFNQGRFQPTMDEILRTDRTTVRRLPARGSYDRALIHSILDEALMCHVGFESEGCRFEFYRARLT
jgi:hypothetical protein